MALSNEVVAAIVSGSAGLLGALVGGLVSWLATRYVQERHWQREDKRRFEAERRTAYVSLMGSIAKFITMPKETLRSDVQAKADWLRAQAEIQLLASPDVERAAHNFSMVVSDHVFNPNPSIPSGEWLRTRQAFIDAVRKDLGLPVSFFTLGGKDAA